MKCSRVRQIVIAELKLDALHTDSQTSSVQVSQLPRELLTFKVGLPESQTARHARMTSINSCFLPKNGECPPAIFSMRHRGLLSFIAIP